jgi:phosphate/sulfate permease
VGAIGAALGFFTALLAGACSQSATLDSIVVVSLMATVLGFGIGLLVSWVFQRYFGNLLEQVSKPASSTSIPSPESDGAQVSAPDATSTPTEDKGQSVDYVFPEFSPDQR